jgi:hypothetical protein
VVMLKRFVIDGWSLMGSRSMLAQNPVVAYLIADVIEMTKSGAARWLGYCRLSPPLLTCT